MGPLLGNLTDAEMAEFGDAGTWLQAIEASALQTE